jgi:WXG100 family type VII secretion target
VTFSYAVDLELASSVLSSLASVESGLSEVVVDLRWRIDRLHSIWDGHAAAAHVSAHQSWVASYDEMHSALVTMRRAVRTARDNYAAAVEANDAMWSSVR